MGRKVIYLDDQESSSDNSITFSDADFDPILGVMIDIFNIEEKDPVNDALVLFICVGEIEFSPSTQNLSYHIKQACEKIHAAEVRNFSPEKVQSLGFGQGYGLILGDGTLGAVAKTSASNYLNFLDRYAKITRRARLHY